MRFARRIDVLPLIRNEVIQLADERTAENEAVVCPRVGVLAADRIAQCDRLPARCEVGVQRFELDDSSVTLAPQCEVSRTLRQVERIARLQASICKKTVESAIERSATRACDGVDLRAEIAAELRLRKQC